MADPAPARPDLVSLIWCRTWIGGDVLSDGIGAHPGRPHSRRVGTEADGDANDDLEQELGAEPGELSEIRFADLVRARQTPPLPLPRAGVSNLPLGDLDPEVLERLAAEMIKRRPNLGAHFYGRRGQPQYGLDIVEREAGGTNSVYQVRRYQVLTPGEITSAVTEYADPQPSKGGGRNRRAGSPPAGTCYSPRRSSRPTRRCRTGWKSSRNGTPVTWSSRCGAGRWSAACSATAGHW
jgi:hypothetical protein